MRRSFFPGPGVLRGIVILDLAASMLFAGEPAARSEASPGDSCRTARETAAQAMAALNRQGLSPKELIARKQALLAVFPEPTPIPKAETPAPVPGRPDLTNRTEPRRVQAEFGAAMSEAVRQRGSRKEIVRRKAELLAVNAETLQWARSAGNPAPEPAPPPPEMPRPLDEMPLRQQLATLTAEIRRQPASPREKIAALEKFRRENAEAFAAAQRNPAEPPALITK